MNETKTLSNFLAGVSYSDLDSDTVTYAKHLFLDWLASAFAGSDSFPVKTLLQVAKESGNSGNSSVIPDKSVLNPLWAGFVNAASSHIVEMDDLHRSSILHPGSPIISAVFAFAEDNSLSGRDVILATVAGYEAGIRIGEALGTSHYQYFHTTGTAGTFGAAVGVCKLFNCSSEEMVNSLGNAGTQASGVWEFLKHGAHSKQLHTAKAAFNGALSAMLAKRGFRGAQTILEGEKGFIVATSRVPHMEKITENLGNGFKLNETSIKFFASCRHTHPSLDAIYKVMDKIKSPDQIQKIELYTYKNACDLVDNPNPVNPYQAKFSLQFTTALLLHRGKIVPEMFNEKNLQDSELRKLMKKITIYHDEKYTKMYPVKWGAKAVIIFVNKENLTSESLYPKGDPENPLSVDELVEKFRLLTKDFLSNEQIKRFVKFSLNLDKIDNVGSQFRKILNLG